VQTRELKPEPSNFYMLGILLQNVENNSYFALDRYRLSAERFSVEFRRLLIHMPLNEIGTMKNVPKKSHGINCIMD